jgi:hypothetical protein
MVISWNPPGKNCGACGSQTCSDFFSRLETGSAEVDLCPFYSMENTLSPEKIGRGSIELQVRNATYSGVDVPERIRLSPPSFPVSLQHANYSAFQGRLW